MTPNAIFPPWGKLLFAACDILVGMLLVKMLASTGRSTSFTSLWILNPFVAIISTRGNAESILSFLVIATIWAISVNKVSLAAVLFGVSVHMKIYPIIYCIPIWFGIDYAMQCGKALQSGKGKKKLPMFKLTMWSRNRLYFGILSAAVFLSCTIGMYILYGQKFLDETYLYHITRKDHRHNFSLYFYHIYLSYDTPSSNMTAVLLFVPQVVLILFLGIYFAGNLPFAFFLQTFAFVMLNKVCTSQVHANNLVFHVVPLSLSVGHCRF
jgi:GPI mannosyltransferase 1 subunit M